MSLTSDDQIVEKVNYRADIDGLRGFAIIAVVLFHYFPTTFPGGFLGVDVFFCISGFLITTFILNELTQNNFTIAGFYKRRIRRIFPALTLVLAASFITGWYILDADRFQELCRNVFGAAIMTANFKSLYDINYFSVSMVLKPLLHLWSISIEEQFYLFWPWIVLFLYRRRINLTVLISLIAIAFFSLGLKLSTEDSFKAYFLTHARIWEILFGCVAAAIRYSNLITNWVRNPSSLTLVRERILPIVGYTFLIATLGMILKLEGATSLGMLVPVLGTLFILVSDDKKGWHHSIFSNRPLRTVGLVSYSLYLWHWPLFSFVRIILGEVPGIGLRVCLMGISFMLAYGTYRFIEQPLRRGFGTKRILTFVLLLSSVGLLGFLGDKNKGFKNRRLALNYRSTSAQEAIKEKMKCKISRNYSEMFDCYSQNLEASDAAIIGDSHATDKYVGLDDVDRQHRWALLDHDSCPPSVGFVTDDPDTDCSGRFEEILQFLGEQTQIKVVVLSYFGYYYGNGMTQAREDSLHRGLAQTISILEKQNKEVVLLIDLPYLSQDPRDCQRSPKQQGCGLKRDQAFKRMEPNLKMAALLKKEFPGLKIYEPSEFICPGELCRTMDNGVSIYNDLHHLSLEGSRLYAEVFLKWLQGQTTAR